MDDETVYYALPGNNITLQCRLEDDGELNSSTGILWTFGLNRRIDRGTAGRLKTRDYAYGILGEKR